MPTITEILTQNSNDKVEIKSQVNLNGQAFKTFKQFVEQLNIYEQVTKIESRNIGGSIGIYGNPAFATYGTSTYGNTPTTGFILGSALAGVLGANKLGETGSSFELIRVIPPNRTFVERFISTDFINGSSTASISGDTATFTAGEYLQSTIIYKNEETISQATMVLSYESGSGNLSSYISADNGITFTRIDESTLSSIDTPGEEVVYKLVATGNAEITKLEVSV